ncbi:MAG TPA: hypothetical protein VII17_03490, partial [Steroidobacteraceae bacterium]
DGRARRMFIGNRWRSLRFGDQHDACESMARGINDRDVEIGRAQRLHDADQQYAQATQGAASALLD